MRAFCLGLALFALTSPAFAQDEEACMAPVVVTPSLIEAVSLYDFSGYAGSEAVPAFVIGWVSPTGVYEDDMALAGAVVFVRNADATWRAFMPRPGEGVVGVYATSSGAMIVATQWQTEGPGQSWMLLRSPDALQTGVCGEIDFPAELNQPTWANEFLSLMDLDINARGRGDIIGVAQTDDRGALWYTYRTRDHGATWSTPQRIARERPARAGIYERLDREGPAPAELVAELTRYAESR